MTAVRAAEPVVAELQQPHGFVGTMNCTAVTCHGRGGPRYWSGSPKGAEYVHWLGTAATYSDGRKPYDPHARLIKTNGDPHALAAQRMQEPRFQEVLRRASGRTDGTVDEAMRAKCAKCHDPGGKQSSEVRGQRSDEENTSGLKHRDHANHSGTHYSVLSAEYAQHQHSSAVAKPVSPSHAREREHSLEEPMQLHRATTIGIGCETCHGGAKNWLTEHYREGVSRQELLQLGMVDTKDLHVRAKLCASCHVGSAENDMNHDMIAAGHPPLRFEQASYEALLGSKHWDDAPARMADGEYEVKLWAAGRVAAAVAALDLLEGRVQGSGFGVQESEHRDQRPWPELAEWNCLACHQPLTRGSDQKIEFGLLTTRGTAAWQSWNTSLVEVALLPTRRPSGELPPPGGDWHASMERLRKTMGSSAVPHAKQVSSLAGEATAALRHQAATSNSRVTALSVLEAIGEVKATASWDEMCQQLAALAAVRRALEDQGKLSRYSTEGVRDRMERLAKHLRFAEADREWPVVYSTGSTMSQADVLRELAELRADLMSGAVE
jgi:hypothetical protein